MSAAKASLVGFCLGGIIGCGVGAHIVGRTVQPYGIGAEVAFLAVIFAVLLWTILMKMLEKV